MLHQKRRRAQSNWMLFSFHFYVTTAISKIHYLNITTSMGFPFLYLHQIKKNYPTRLSKQPNRNPLNKHGEPQIKQVSVKKWVENLNWRRFWRHEGVNWYQWLRNVERKRDRTMSTRITAVCRRSCPWFIERRCTSFWHCLLGGNGNS